MYRSQLGLDPVIDEFIAMGKEQALRLRDSIKTAWLANSKAIADTKVAKFKMDTYASLRNQISDEIKAQNLIDQAQLDNLIWYIFIDSRYLGGSGNGSYPFIFWPSYGVLDKLVIAPFEQGPEAVKNWYLDRTDKTSINYDTNWINNYWPLLKQAIDSFANKGRTDFWEIYTKYISMYIPIFIKWVDAGWEYSTKRNYENNTLIALNSVKKLIDDLRIQYADYLVDIPELKTGDEVIADFQRQATQPQVVILQAPVVEPVVIPVQEPVVEQPPVEEVIQPEEKPKSKAPYVIGALAVAGVLLTASGK